MLEDWIISRHETGGNIFVLILKKSKFKLKLLKKYRWILPNKHRIMLCSLQFQNILVIKRSLVIIGLWGKFNTNVIALIILNNLLHSTELYVCCFVCYLIAKTIIHLQCSKYILETLPSIFIDVLKPFKTFCIWLSAY